MFSKEDLEQIRQKGIDPEGITTQLNQFKHGFPYLNIYGSATVGQGISTITFPDAQRLRNSWDEYLKGNRRVGTFVPASGAASRMFKDLHEWLESPRDTPMTAFVRRFFDHINQFAWYEALDEVYRRNHSKSLEEAVHEGAYKSIIRTLLSPDGLNYGKLPKGLLLFHHTPKGARKAVVEHLVEGALYAKNAQGQVNVHFTVSPEHLGLFEQAIQEAKPGLEQQYGVHFAVSFSVQKPATDTLAATVENLPFRENGLLVFRPGGHGSLIENLNDLNLDIVFIKNIDNVVPDRLKASTVATKQLLAGLLVELQQKAFTYLIMLESGRYTHESLLEIIHFLQRDLCTRFEGLKLLEDSELALYLKRKLNRPIRVCGMVKNVGEPGGGPFWVYNADSSHSLHILESSQIDMSNPEKRKLFEQGTHFNPVDLVCALTNYQGKPFHLPDYVDTTTGFIAGKSKNGNVLKALERPGLWNGAMSDWNTVFVEVPLDTFNPVKTINDLLRPEHQPA